MIEGTVSQATHFALGDAGQTGGGQPKNLRWRRSDVDILTVVTSKYRDRLPFEAPAASVGVSRDPTPQPLWKSDGACYGAVDLAGCLGSSHNQKYTILVNGA